MRRAGPIQGQSNGSSKGVLGTELEAIKIVQETTGLLSLPEVLLSGSSRRFAGSPVLPYMPLKSEGTLRATSLLAL